MNEEQLKGIAAQLRQPHGDNAKEVGERMNQGNAQMNRDVLAAVNAQAENNILEIGMGNGFFVKEILAKDKTIHYTGVDFSELMVVEAEQRNEEWIKEGRAVFVHADLASLPLDNDLYNKIFTVNTVYFWEDPAKNLAQLKRVMRTDGRLYIGLRPRHQMEQYPFTKYGFNLFSQEEITKLLTNNGFEVLNVTLNKEPDFDFNGQTIVLENMVVEAKVR